MESESALLNLNLDTNLMNQVKHIWDPKQASVRVLAALQLLLAVYDTMFDVEQFIKVDVSCFKELQTQDEEAAETVENQRKTESQRSVTN